MYGVPVNLDLSRFIGSTLQQLCIGEYQVQFHFDSEASLSVEGEWTLRGPDGSDVDQSRENTNRDAYRLHQVLGKRVLDTAIDPPRSITLRFETGHEHWVFDNTEHYESFSIEPGDIII